MLSNVKFSAGVRHFIEILDHIEDKPTQPGCVIGCGDGTEVLYLESRLRIAAYGLDLEIRTPHSAHMCLIQSDGLSLPVPDQSLGFAFLHHVLEHVKDPDLCLREISRALVPGRPLYLGTPNKNRLVAYLGSRRATQIEKVLWNLADYRDRLLGRFENEMGAHAGFHLRDLHRLTAKHFANVTVVTEDYQRFKYGNRLPPPLMAMIVSPKLINRLAPAHYLLCSR